MALAVLPAMALPVLAPELPPPVVDPRLLLPNLPPTLSTVPWRPKDLAVQAMAEAMPVMFEGMPVPRTLWEASSSDRGRLCLVFLTECRAKEENGSMTVMTNFQLQ